MKRAIMVLAFLCGCFSAVNVVALEETKDWRFRVLLDDKPIGFHDFSLERAIDSQRLRSEANFEFKLLFVTLFEYEHENVEVWQDDCLQKIESNTDSNGKPLSLSGQAGERSFVLQSNDGTAELPSCVWTFAYWNPEFLNQTRLLNSQSGEYLDVNVSGPEQVQLPVRGEPLPAVRYDLVAGDIKLQLWYSLEDEWLALESETESGRMLRYELL